MGYMRLEGTRAIVDCASDPLEFTSPAWINSHLKDLANAEGKIRTIRYEEEIIVDFDEEKTKVLTEYASLIRQVEGILLNSKTYGLKEDDRYEKRRKALKDFYEYMFMNPLLASRTLEDYKEPLPEKQVFVDGYNTFRAWTNGILKSYKASKLYKLVEQTGDLRQAFLSLAGLRSLQFIQSIQLTPPPGVKYIESPDNGYDLGFGIKAKIYSLPSGEANLYILENPIIENLPRELGLLLRNAIVDGMKQTYEGVDFSTIFETKTREYRQFFVDQATMQGVKITPQQAIAMGREAAAWTVGLGSPIENMSLDRDSITDIYIDSENSPLYIEHAKFGLCHTLWRYNREMLEHAFLNIMATTKQSRKFDSNNPVVDVMLTRLNMRCHLQRPPATFGELQAALRMTKETPFTYAQYLYYRAFSAFFAGYDDVMVSLGCSEAVLGLKGVGKTAFTSAKIEAIGTKRRILPIQDIEEIPTKAYRKRGFHIGAMRVQSSDKEETSKTELDLVSMANASLRMGDSCLIINEIRSRLAIQGVINLLNTQPGVFLLYNLHAQSLRDIQDRLELVFGMPAATMFTTDRYSFLKKVRFGRKGRVYRVLGNEYETDQEQRKFVEVFTFKRANDIDSSKLICNFLENEEATKFSLVDLNMADIEKNLHVTFVPPALRRRSIETGIPPEQYMLQAFFKGKMYSQILDESNRRKDKMLLELDFVHKCNSTVNRMLRENEREDGSVDFAALEKNWQPMFQQMIDQDIAERSVQAVLAAKGVKPGTSGKGAEEPEEGEAEGEARAAPKKR